VIRRVLRVDPNGDLFRYRTRERLKKLLSPRWLAHRLAASAYAIRHPESPWVVPEALDEIARRLRHEDKVFEWGSGLSTPWLAERAGTVTAVEHNAAWAKKASAMLEQKALRNAEVRLVSEAQYFAQLDAVADGSLDLIMVDGMENGRTLGLSLPRLRPGGLLVLNRAQDTLPSESLTPGARSRAEGPHDSVDPLAFVELQRWAVKWFTDGINDTAVFTKP
jgi:predicted O-methyltransferase YrrM